MGKVQKRCRICGKLYTPCNDCENDKQVFRWRNVACSQKCAQEYFRRIDISRGVIPQSDEKTNAETNTTKKKRERKTKEEKGQIV